MKFPNNLRAMREHQGVRRCDLVENAGVDANNVTRLERGMYYPKLATAYRLAAALGVAVETIWPNPYRKGKR